MPQQKSGIFVILSLSIFSACWIHGAETAAPNGNPNAVKESPATVDPFKNPNYPVNLGRDLAAELTYEDSHGIIDDTPEPTKEALLFKFGTLDGKLQIKYKPESFWGKNINLLNNSNDGDRLMFSRSTLDFNIGVDLCKNCINFFGTVRNKATWGDPQSIAQTTETRLKILESVQDGHQHFIAKQIMWIRELWLKFCLNETFGLNFSNQHFLTIGAFPFELGRGISLGAAFAVNPGPLGFYSDNSIDQYAFGYKLTGDLVASKLSYDLYGAILQNKSASISQTSENIYGQRFDHFFDPARGSGHVNFGLAGRIKWFAKNTDTDLAVFEPYFFFNEIPEVKVDFPADSRVKLGTIGMAAEFKRNNFEFGFDGARNLGGQRVFGWDRNSVEDINRNGVFTLVYSQVVTADPITNSSAPKAVYDPGSPLGKAVQELVNQSSICQDAAKNGQFIGTASADGDSQDLWNSRVRFREQYNNKFLGWMFVFDGAYWFCDRQLRLAAGGGVASGDENPNLNIVDPNMGQVDRDYKGFIGINEIYTGNRVQSAFLLGGAGRIPRLLSPPLQRNVFQRFPARTSGFTNLIFTGASVYLTPKDMIHKLDVRCNFLSYWQQHATKKFDRATKLSSTEYARKHLGYEGNMFMTVHLIQDFNFFAVGSAFVPGNHYKDIKGTPLNSAQQRILDRADVTGADPDTLPLLGDNVAWTINLGLEYRF